MPEIEYRASTHKNTRTLSYFINLRIYMGTIDNQNKCTYPCTRQVKNPLRTENGCYRDCVPAAGRICRRMLLLQWTGTRGWSPHRNKLKIDRSPILPAPDKTQKPWSQWTTSEKHPRSPPQEKRCPSKPAQMPKEECWEKGHKSLCKLSNWKRLTLQAEHTESPTKIPTTELL